jgi:hypothetical protein
MRQVRGHGVKGKQHETKLETLKNPIVLTNARSNKTFPILGHTPYVDNMCSGGRLTKNGHFLGTKPIGKIFMSNIPVGLMII